MDSTKVNLNEIQAGMVLADNLTGISGNMLLVKGTVVTPFLKRRLQTAFPGELILVVDSAPAQKPSGSAKEGTSECVQMLFQASTYLEQLMRSLSAGGSVDFSRIEQAVARIIVRENKRSDFWRFLEYAYDKERKVYEHGVAVAGLASIVGRWRGLSEAQVYEVSLAAYLHDVGKAVLPHNKLGLLRHPRASVDSLRQFMLNSRIMSGILQHHERNDGSGYPRQLHNEDIQVYGKIIAVCDEFHSLVQQDIEKDSCFLPNIAFSLLGKAPQQLDILSIKALIDSLIPHYRGRRVLLSTNETGIVVDFFNRDISQPIVQSARGAIDLSANKSVHIRKAV